jgi:Flp pilus assembly pilin Flp
MLRRLWNDDSGVGLLSAEWLFLFAILVLGIITGLVAVRQALISELTESAQSLLAINQSFSFSGQSNCEAFTGGSSGSDTTNTINEGSVFSSFSNINQTPCD